ncbi:MAG: cell envelope integrity protein TolA [Pseudomonadota bacterium]
MMMQSSVDKMNANALSIMLHGALIGATMVGANMNFQWPWMGQGDCTMPIVEAVMIDEAQVMQELAQIRERDTQSNVAAEQLTRTKKELEDIAKAKSELEQEMAALRDERDQLDLAKQNTQRQVDAERIELAKQKREQDRLEASRRALEQRAKEREKKAREEEEKRIARKQAKEVEQARLDAERRKNLASATRSYQDAIRRKIENSLIVPTGLPPGLSCVLDIRTIPSGDVSSVTIRRSSGYSQFDQAAINATYQASPLPVPPDRAIYEDGGFRSLQLNFRPVY